MEKLKVGDKVVNIRFTNNCKPIYTFAHVVSLTKTRAKLDNGYMLINEPFKDNEGSKIIVKFIRYGERYSCWELSTPEIEKAYENHLYQRDVDYWFRNRKFTDDEKKIIYEKFKELNILNK